MALRLQLAALKRAYWPWEWDDSRDSGVLLAVEAAAYADTNRMNTVRSFHFGYFGYFWLFWLFCYFWLFLVIFGYFGYRTYGQLY
jgi:hypothetical protein